MIRMILIAGAVNLILAVSAFPAAAYTHAMVQQISLQRQAGSAGARVHEQMRRVLPAFACKAEPGRFVSAVREGASASWTMCLLSLGVRT